MREDRELIHEQAKLRSEIAECTYSDWIKNISRLNQVPFFLLFLGLGWVFNHISMIWETTKAHLEDFSLAVIGEKWGDCLSGLKIEQC